MKRSLNLVLSPWAAELQDLTDDGAQNSTELGRMDIGYAAMETLFFKQGHLNAASLERAIEWTEDLITAARILVPAGAQLWTREADVRELAQVSGLNLRVHSVLHVDAVEQTFSRLVMQSMGQASAQEMLPETARFYATVVFVRELMHHLHFSQIHLLDAA